MMSKINSRKRKIW